MSYRGGCADCFAIQLRVWTLLCIQPVSTAGAAKNRSIEKGEQDCKGMPHEQVVRPSRPCCQHQPVITSARPGPKKPALCVKRSWVSCLCHVQEPNHPACHHCNLGAKRPVRGLSGQGVRQSALAPRDGRPDCSVALACGEQHSEGFRLPACLPCLLCILPL
ncbi:hypothetical protein BKA81DRAFT_225625 [Phyllosticta paracitricarpa]